MNSRLGSTNSAMLTALTLAAVMQAGLRPAAADGNGASLKWTPHRASTPVPLDPDELEVPAAAETSADQLVGPPASVTLPDRVPVGNPARRPARTASAAPATRSAAGRPAASQPAPGGIGSRTSDTGNPDAVFGVRVMRTPQSPAGRPTRTGPAAGDRRPDASEARLGGGLAPRYGGQRPERLAMNVDGIPSVMTQAPQAGGLDDAAVPGRVPPGTGTRDQLPTPAAGAPPDVESIGPGIELPDEALGFVGPGDDFGGGFMDGASGGSEGGLLMGDYPTELHVESFYDDPYACDDDENLLPMCSHHGRICNWLRQFGRPYYGWRWYRDFTASAGITSFTNATDLGLAGNFGANEYLNWSMPFWNAFGVGWQVGWRGVQTHLQPATIQAGGLTVRQNARDQQFLTTGFFTRAFEGRGLQGGIVYDYLHDSWFENTDLAQLRYEISYVWGYHEFGFWGASNITDQIGVFGRRRPASGVADTLTLYNGFYRVQFGDANELKIWGGATDEQDGVVGALVRAPLHRSLAVEGTFTYVIPNRTHVVTLSDGGEQTQFAPAAWNLGLNVVWYPAARSRRSLASPYRPLFEVADNGSMIRSLEGLLAP